MKNSKILKKISLLALGIVLSSSVAINTSAMSMDHSNRSQNKSNGQVWSTDCKICLLKVAHDNKSVLEKNNSVKVWNEIISKTLLATEFSGKQCKQQYYKLIKNQSIENCLTDQYYLYLKEIYPKRFDFEPKKLEIWVAGIVNLELYGIDYDDCGGFRDVSDGF